MFSKWFHNFSFTNEKENNVLTQASQLAYVGILMENDDMLFLQKKFLNGFLCNKKMLESVPNVL